MQFVTCSTTETQALAQDLYARFPSHRFWCLYGELGAGKTAFAKGFGACFGIPARNIKSPTYTYVWEHALAKGGVLYHCDLYRVASVNDWFALGLTDRFTDDDVVLLEWADRIAPVLPEQRLDLHFTVLSSSERSITVTAYD